MKYERIHPKEKSYREWAMQMPLIQFPSNWLVKIIPPFGGAAVRFLVEKDYKFLVDSRHRQISVYADFDSSLGVVERPYWEIYPNENGENERFLLNETEELLKAISRSLSVKG